MINVFNELVYKEIRTKCRILCDEASKDEVHGKPTTLNRQFYEILRKTLTKPYYHQEESAIHQGKRVIRFLCSNCESFREIRHLYLMVHPMFELFRTRVSLEA